MILSLRNEGAEIYNVEAVPYNSMKAAGLLGEILGQDGLNNTGSEESSRSGSFHESYFCCLIALVLIYIYVCLLVCMHLCMHICMYVFK